MSRPTSVDASWVCFQRVWSSLSLVMVLKVVLVLVMVLMMVLIMMLVMALLSD